MGEWLKLKWRGGKGHGYLIPISLILMLCIAFQFNSFGCLFLLGGNLLILNGLFFNVDVTIFHCRGGMKDGWIYKTIRFQCFVIYIRLCLGRNYGLIDEVQ
ncbi:hypothetical protein ACEUDN_21160 [Aeromonas hydrophila]|uniref:hypothetical protein n=1 Tax=Aeromonas hydrophila TaxID=644 RepID=UPI0038D16310